MVAELFGPREVREYLDELNKLAGHLFGNKVRMGSREPAVPEKEAGEMDIKVIFTIMRTYPTVVSTI
jgi:hypothetical protein